MIGGMIRHVRCGPEKEIPVEFIRNRHFRIRSRYALRPDGTVGPDVHFVNGTDGAGLDPFDNAPAIIVRVTLIAHLRHDTCSFRLLEKHTRLSHRSRERLLDVDVLAQIHCCYGRDRMGVVGRGDNDGVDVRLHLIEHLPKIGISRSVGKAFEGFGRAVPVDIRQRDDILACHLLQIVAAHAAGSDRGDVQLVAGRRVPDSAEYMTGNDRNACGGEGRAL